MKKEVSDLLHQYSVIIMYKERRSYNANNKTNYRCRKKETKSVRNQIFIKGKKLISYLKKEKNHLIFMNIAQSSNFSCLKNEVTEEKGYK